MEVDDLASDVLALYVSPNVGHPSSLWPSKALIHKKTGRAYVLPEDIGITEPLSSRIMVWTLEFRRFFKDDPHWFHDRPTWKPGIEPYKWYDEGYEIVFALREFFPAVEIIPQFAHYVFSAN